MSMWLIDLAVAAGFAIGVAVKRIVDVSEARKRQPSPASEKLERRERQQPPQ